MHKRFLSCVFHCLLKLSFLHCIYQLDLHLLHSLIFFRQSSSNDEDLLNLIKQFQTNYNENKTMEYLTRNTPISRFLNKALREENISMLFSLRFFLQDISKYFISYELPSVDNLSRLMLLKNFRII